ncbi:alpha/beta fold hydrolase [Microbacterium sp. zg.Y625]|nr:alpha/beta fold hydrolase [Microbacterium sp. zg.Y625]
MLPALRAAGHSPRPLTLPGVGAPAADSAEIGIADWVDAVVAEIDAASGPVVLVGHSGGGNVAWGAADARPERVARVVFVDTVPPPHGGTISEFDTVDGVVPFPGWDFFDDDDVADLDAPTRAATAQRTRSVPARVPTDPLALTDGRRHAVPVTILSGALNAETLPGVIAEWGAFADESRRSTTRRWCTSAAVTGRSSHSPSRSPTLSYAPSDVSVRSQCPMPRPPSTGITAPEM